MLLVMGFTDVELIMYVPVHIVLFAHILLHINTWVCGYARIAALLDVTTSIRSARPTTTLRAASSWFW